MTTSFVGRLGTAPEEAMKAPCIVAATTNIILSGEQTISGIAVTADPPSRVLAAGQDDLTENGVYDVSTNAWSRSTDWNDEQDVVNGQLVSVPNSIYEAQFSGDFDPGTTSIVFVDLNNITINNTAQYDLGTQAAAASHPNIITGYKISTNFRNGDRIPGSGSEAAHTGVELGSGDPLAGKWFGDPDVPSGLGYDATAKEFKIYGVEDVLKWGATVDGTDAQVAIQAAVTIGSDVVVSKSHTVIKAVQMKSDFKFGGNGELIRSDATTETIDTLSIASILYTKDVRNLKLHDLKLTGTRNANDVDAIVLNGLNNSSMRDMKIDGFRNGLETKTSVYMTEFSRVWMRGIKTTAWDFSDDAFDTSLTFNSCWVENSAQPYDFNRTIYSTMNSCGADWCNLTSGGPYGAGAVYGAEDTDKGIYHFRGSNFTLNSIASESSFGNGMINANNENTTLTVNAPVCQSCASSFEPNYAGFPLWATAPIIIGAQGAAVNVTTARPLEFENTYATGLGKPQAEVVGYNYNVGNGVINNCKVFVACPSEDASSKDIILGADATQVLRHTRVLYDMYDIAQFQTEIAIDQRSYTRSISITGTGTVITIPITSQGSLNRSHVMQIFGMQGEANSIVTKKFSGFIGVVSLTTLKDISADNLVGISGAAASSMNLQITLSVSTTNPQLTIDYLSKDVDLIEWDNISIA